MSHEGRERVRGRGRESKVRSGSLIGLVDRKSGSESAETSAGKAWVAKKKTCAVLKVRKERDNISGDNSLRDPPVPIPNTEVKPQHADGTWLETARESRTSPDPISAGVLPIGRAPVLCLFWDVRWEET